MAFNPEKIDARALVTMAAAATFRPMTEGEKMLYQGAPQGTLIANSIPGFPDCELLLNPPENEYDSILSLVYMGTDEEYSSHQVDLMNDGLVQIIM